MPSTPQKPHALANLVIEVMSERHDQHYINQKRKELSTFRTAAEVIFWAIFYLDSTNMEALAKRLGMDVRDLLPTRRLMRTVVPWTRLD